MATKKQNKKADKVKSPSFARELIKQMIALSTSGFGLVAALAWNSVIQEFVNSYIKKWVHGSGLITLFIYALLVTLLAVLVTYQLSRIASRLGVNASKK